MATPPRLYHHEDPWHKDQHRGASAQGRLDEKNGYLKKKKKNRFIIGGFVCMEDFYLWGFMFGGVAATDLIQHPRVAVSVTEGKKKERERKNCHEP